MANVIRGGKLRPPTSIPSVLSLLLSLSVSPSPNTFSLCPCNWEVHLLDRIDKCSTNKRQRSPRIHLSHVAWHGRQTNVGTGQTNRRAEGRADRLTETKSMRAIQIDFVAVKGHSLSPIPREHLLQLTFNLRHRFPWRQNRLQIVIANAKAGQREWRERESEQARSLLLQLWVRCSSSYLICLHFHFVFAQLCMIFACCCSCCCLTCAINIYWSAACVCVCVRRKDRAISVLSSLESFASLATYKCCSAHQAVFKQHVDVASSIFMPAVCTTHANVASSAVATLKCFKQLFDI